MGEGERVRARRKSAKSTTTLSQQGCSGDGDRKERDEGTDEELEVMEENDGEVWSEEEMNHGAEMEEAAESENFGNPEKENGKNTEGEGHVKTGDISESRGKEQKKVRKGYGGRTNAPSGHLSACFGQSRYSARQEGVLTERGDTSKSGSRQFQNRSVECVFQTP